jgi:polar amino acid transport system substrate-binding protein
VITSKKRCGGAVGEADSVRIGKTCILVCLLVVLFAVLTGAATAGNGGTLGGLQKAGVVKVGFAAFAPYSFRDKSGKTTGSEFKVLSILMKDLGVPRIQPVLVDVAGLIPGLQAGRFDMVVSLLDITTARCQQVIYANPYEGVLESFAVKKGNPLNIRTFKDIRANPKIRVAYLIGGAEIRYLQDAGVKSSQIKAYPSLLNGFDALRAGRIDAFVGDNIGIGYPVATGSYPDLASTPPFAPTLKGKPAISFPGIALRKDEGDLRDALNKKIAQLQKTTNVLIAVGKPYGLSRTNYDVAKGKTAASLCKAG